MKVFSAVTMSIPASLLLGWPLSCRAQPEASVVANTCAVDFDVETLNEAIFAFGTQCGISVLIKGQLMDRSERYAFSGEYTIEDILNALLLGQSFQAVESSKRMLVVELRAPPRAEYQPRPAVSLDPGNDAPLTDMITVTGTRLQNARLIQTKREAVLITDAASADEIGRYPDFNVADATRRIPGVINFRDEEEGISLGLRGLAPEFVFVTMDGTAFATEPTRRTRGSFVEILPSTLFSSIDVVKARDASIDGNTIGGQIDFVTRSAFDHPGLYATLSASVGTFTADNFDRDANDPAFRLDGTLSTVFGDDDELGIVLAGAYFTRDQDEERTLTYYDQDFTAPTFTIGNGIESPFERFGGYAKVEYAPSDDLTIDVSARGFRQNETFLRGSAVLSAADGAVDLETAKKGSIQGATGRLEFLESDDPKWQVALAMNATYTVSTNTDLHLRGSLSRAGVLEGDGRRSDAVFNYSGPEDGLDYTFEFRGADRPPHLHYRNRGIAEDLSHYSLSSVRIEREENASRLSDVEASLSHDVPQTGFGLLAGLRYKDTSYRFDVDRRDILYTGQEPLLLSRFGRLSTFRPPSGAINAPIIDNGAILDLIETNPSVFDSLSSSATDVRDDFDVQERVLAGYASLRYQAERLAANAGLRIETTQIDGKGFQSDDGSYAPIRERADYTNVLPSLGMTYSANTNIEIRASYSQAVGRANLPDLSPSLSVVDGAEGPSIRAGNIDLRPRHAHNLDTSLEYYFDQGRSLVAAAIFHKRISDNIAILTTESTAGGEVVPTTRPANTGETTLWGAELTLIKDKFDWLPGPFADLGGTANYTYIDGKTSVFARDGTRRDVAFLTEQPEHLANLAVFYQRGRFDGRCSHSLIGEYAQSIDPSDPRQDDFIAAYGTWDAHARWRISDRFTLTAEGRNLTDEKSVGRTGPGRSRVEDLSRFGSAFFVGLTYQH